MSSASCSPACRTKRRSRDGCAGSSRRFVLGLVACGDPDHAACRGSGSIRTDGALDGASDTCRSSQSWAIQRRVIWALVLREMLTRYRAAQHRLPVAVRRADAVHARRHGALDGEPSRCTDRTSRSSRLPSPAIRACCCGATCPAAASARSTPNLSLLYHRNVRPIDIYLARLILEAAGATMSFVFLVLFFSFVGLAGAARGCAAGRRRLAHAGLVRGVAWRCSLARCPRRPKRSRSCGTRLSYLLFPLSGAAFLVDALPQPAQEYRAAAADGARRRISARRLFRLADHGPL